MDKKEEILIEWGINLPKGEWIAAQEAMESYATHRLQEAEERIKELEEGLQQIADNEGTCCMRCEGNGKLWADGKAHYPSYEGDTVNCGHCGGEGRIYEDAKEIAISLLSPNHI